MQISNEAVFSYLSHTGIKYGNQGFYYCALSIKLASESSGPPLNIREIYQMIADYCGKSSECISRSIRYSLQPLGITNKEFLLKAFYEVKYEIDLENGSPPKAEKEKVPIYTKPLKAIITSECAI